MGVGEEVDEARELLPDAPLVEELRPPKENPAMSLSPEDLEEEREERDMEERDEMEALRECER